MSNSFITDQTPAGDWEVITVSSTAIGPTAGKLLVAQTGGFKKRVVRVFLSIETDAVRARWDGGTPTSANGHKFSVGDSLILEGESNIANLKMIRVTTDASVQLTYSYNI